MNHVDTVYVGAAEAFKMGAKDRDDLSRSDYKACADALKFFERFSDKQMAFALLMCMHSLGERINKSGLRLVEG